ncbi:MAG: TRAP transporter large permease subunit [Holophagales bacterium]|nr:TRAP transporter large permease subunit [Holophagales bacterium]MYC10844.1 TRAP transporter large permease subunit [Holophagales bacterium]
MTEDATAVRPWAPVRFLHRLEDGVSIVLLGAMVLLPLAEIVVRQLGTGIPGALPFEQHLTLWVAFLGAALAAREGRLLALATGNFLPEGRFRAFAAVFTGGVSAMVATLLGNASLDLVQIEREGGIEMAAGVPVWVGQAVMPVGFAILALRLAWKSSDLWAGRAIAGFGIVLGLWIGANADSFADRAATPWLVLILASTLLGGPIFAALGGAAVFLFLSDFVPLAAVPAESYRLAVSPTLAAIPLFTLTGFLLAEGGASERLLRVFRALFGWVPGSTPVVCAVVCAFFTVFTGGSGVTILALGGVLFAALSADGYRERFSLGLLTSSGSLGLLLPPALPLILFGIVAEVPIEDLFIGGLLPGLLLIALIAAWGVREGLRRGTGKARTSVVEDDRGIARALWAAKWELLLPVVILVAFFSGYATLVETAALAALYAFVVQCLVHRDVRLGKPLLAVFRQCVVLVGGVLIILVAAMGLTSWLVDAQAAQALVELVQNNIESKIVFLLALNVFLLLVGCLMDIFSATVVVVPLIIPLGLAFGVDPIHLGIIFVANLELGYLTPPVGLNLFLASYRFERPLLAVYRAAVPALVILGIGVLLITYVPGLTLGLLDLLGRT